MNPAYARRASPLHAVRAPVAAAYAIALVTAVLMFEHPLALAALGVAILAAGVAAGVARALARAALFGVPFALFIALVNPLVVREGLTVWLRLGELPPFGELDVTREGVVFGAILGTRALLVVLAGGALLAATVDPDEVLRRFRRLSLRSSLTAALAVRLVPVLGRDARRLADARRCRPDAPLRPGPAERLQIVRALATGALDRAVDVAATLEVRGYGMPGPRPAAAGSGAPWSRHDIAFAAAAVGLLALAAGARVVGVAGFDAYPTVQAPVGTGEVALAAALVVVALAPFGQRRGVR